MNVRPCGMPTSSQNAAGRGSVATMSEYSGMSRRCVDPNVAVYASVASTTLGARTVPRAVSTRPLDQPVTSVCSWMTAPRRSSTSASPATSFAGCSRAHAGSKDAPSAPVTPCTRSRSQSSIRSTPYPAASSTSARAARSCTFERAQATVPPFAKSQSMPSAAVTRPTSSTVVDHGAAHRERRIPPMSPLQRCHGGGEQRAAPAAVATGRTESGELLLEHRRSAGTGRARAGSTRSRAR